METIARLVVRFEAYRQNGLGRTVPFLCASGEFQRHAKRDQLFVDGPIRSALLAPAGDVVISMRRRKMPQQERDVLLARVLFRGVLGADWAPAFSARVFEDTQNMPSLLLVKSDRALAEFARASLRFAALNHQAKRVAHGRRRGWVRRSVGAPFPVTDFSFGRVVVVASGAALYSFAGGAVKLPVPGFASPEEPHENTSLMYFSQWWAETRRSP